MPQSATRANHAIGTIVLAIFGAVWLALWCIQPNGPPKALLLVIAAIALALCILGIVQFRRNMSAYFAEAKTPSGKRSARLLGIVNIAQWVFVFAAAAVLSRFGQLRWLVPTIIFIVGVHFLPLAPLLSYRPYYGTAVALALLAVLYPLVAAAGPESTVGLIGAGIILWATGVALLLASKATTPSK